MAKQTYFIQLNEDVITDVITYPYGSYQEVEMESPVPAGINAGWYRWNGTEAVLDETLKPVEEESNIIEGEIIVE